MKIDETISAKPLSNIIHHIVGMVEPRKIDTSTVDPAATIAPPMKAQNIDPRDAITLIYTPKYRISSLALAGDGQSRHSHPCLATALPGEAHPLNSRPRIAT